MLPFLSALLLAAALPAEPCVGERVGALTVTGSSLSSATLAEVRQRFADARDTADTRRAIARAVAAAYAHVGIALYDVSVLPGAGGCGIVRLAAVEGRVGEVALNGDADGRAARHVRRLARRLLDERPLRTATLQRTLTLIRDVPGVSVDAALEHTSAPDRLRLALTLHRRRAEIVIGADNGGTRLLGRGEFAAQAALYGLAAGGDALQLAGLLGAEPRKLRAASATYALPLDGIGTNARLSWSGSRSDLRFLAYRGGVGTAGLAFERPLLRRYDRSVSVALGVSRGTASGRLFGYDLLGSVGAAGTATLTARAASQRSELRATLGFDLGRARTRSDFVAVGRSTPIRRLSADLRSARTLGRRLTVRVNAAAQAGSRRLPPFEQVYYGGADLGRAFEPGFLAGDQGAGALAELAWRPATRATGGRAPELYAFADAAASATRDPLTDAAFRGRLASAGGGVRLATGDRSLFQVEAARGWSDVYGAHRVTRASVSARVRL